MYILESIRHLEKFPFQLFITSIDSCCFHWHYDYEVVLLLNGSIKINAHNRDIVLKQGGLCVLNSGEVHSILSMSNNICLILQFPPDIFKKIGSAKRNYIFDIVNRKLSEDQKINQVIKHLLDIAIFLKDKKIGYELHVEGAYYQLVAHLLDSGLYSISQNSPKISYETEIELLNQLNDYVQRNYAEGISIKDICKALAISPAAMYTFLKETIGMTIGDLIRYYRIREAKRLLLETQHTNYHIAFLCGYKNEMTFYRGFKKEMGVTPNHFRKGGESETSAGPIQGYTSFNTQEAYHLMSQIKKNLQL